MQQINSATPGKKNTKKHFCFINYKITVLQYYRLLNAAPRLGPAYHTF